MGVSFDKLLGEPLLHTHKVADITDIADNYLKLDATNDPVTGELLVTAGTATDIPLTVKGAVSQSADIVQFQDSTGAEVAGVTSIGGYTTNISLTDGNNALLSRFITTLPSGASGGYSNNTSGFRADMFLDLNGVNRIVNGGYFNLAYRGTGTYIGDLKGAYFSARVESNGGDATMLIGGEFASISSGNRSSYADYYIGGLFTASANSTTTRTAIDAIGGKFVVEGDGDVTPARAIGMLVNDVTIGTSNFAILTGTGLNSFGDTVKSTGRQVAVASKSTNYTLTANDEVVVFTATATATLPSASGSGQTYRICNEGTGTVTIDGNSSDTIKGSTTQTLAAGEDLIVTDYAANKWV